MSARPQDQGKVSRPQDKSAPLAPAGPSRPARVLEMGPGPLSTGVLGGWLAHHPNLTLSSVPVSHAHHIRLQVSALVIKNIFMLSFISYLSGIFV